MPSDPKARAALRLREASKWPIRSHNLGEEPLRDALDTSTVDERIAMMWPLAKEGWSVAGKPMPTYARATMPGASLRRDD